MLTHWYLLFYRCISPPTCVHLKGREFVLYLVIPSIQQSPERGEAPLDSLVNGIHYLPNDSIFQGVSGGRCTSTLRGGGLGCACFPNTVILEFIALVHFPQ